MADPIADAALILAKEPAIFGLMTLHVTLATAFGILKADWQGKAWEYSPDGPCLVFGFS